MLESSRSRISRSRRPAAPNIPDRAGPREILIEFAGHLVDPVASRSGQTRRRRIGAAGADVGNGEGWEVANEGLFGVSIFQEAQDVGHREVGASHRRLTAAQGGIDDDPGRVLRIHNAAFNAKGGPKHEELRHIPSSYAPLAVTADLIGSTFFSLAPLFPRKSKVDAGSSPA
jgi:hypothetical protein